MSIPVVSFTDERLANGLRLIIAEDHLAPVVAVNVWYGVGSKHEVPGKTGFAHLFEHVMFQGSRNVGKAEHIALVQAAGGTMNGTTWLDRTNYFETMPSHQLELALWLEADRMGTLLDALSQENLDNQREVVKNEKRWSYDNRPYGSWSEKLQAHLYPPEHPYHHPTIGSMEDLDAASVEDVSAFFRTYYAPEQRRPVDRRRRRPGRRPGLDRALLRADPGQPVDPAAGRHVSLPPIARRGAPRGRRGPGPAAPDLLRLPGAGARRRAPRRDRGGDPDPGRRQGQPAPSPARPRRADRPGRRRRSASGSSAARRSGPAGRPSGRASPIERVEAVVPRGARPARSTSRSRDDELARAHALIETEELGALQRVEERADRLSMYATLFDDPDLINRMLGRYLSVTPDRIQAVAGRGLPGRQPGRHDLRAGAAAGRGGARSDSTPGALGGPTDDGDDEEAA